MTQDKRFNDVLDECLNQILKGETVERCLRSHPEQAQELEPLLRAALTAKMASTIQPRPEFRARARYEFQSALHEMVAKKQHKFSFHWRPQWQWRSGWAVAIMAVIGVVLAGGGTVAAASNSMPDNALYPVKLATEQVQLAIAPSNTDKAELNARFADRRAEEIDYLASKGETQRIRSVAESLNTNLKKVNDLTATENVPEASNQSQTNEPVQSAQPSIVVSSGETPGARMTTTPRASVITPKTSPGLAPGESKQMRNNTAQTSARQRLKQALTDRFNYCQSRLEEALKKASPEARPAILRAIAESKASYEKALNNLGQTDSGN